ncbi:MAG: hypothetical protein JRD87_14500 [Deltaproteobacteria bacterium]|nr:hypothetical protein [Deltaproteobacteria bacterium]
MKQKILIFLAAFLTMMVFSAESFARVEWDVQQKLKMDTPPVDVAVSTDGKWIFVLNDSGTILIYSSNGKLEDKISVGSHVDQIRVGPKDNLLLLSSRKNKTVELLTIDFINKINISGSPFKGSADAPVVVAVIIRKT